MCHGKDFNFTDIHKLSETKTHGYYTIYLVWKYELKKKRDDVGRNLTTAVSSVKHPKGEKSASSIDIAQNLGKERMGAMWKWKKVKVEKWNSIFIFHGMI